MGEPAVLTEPRHTHEAFFYSKPNELIEYCAEFVLAGLALDEPVVVALVGPRLQLLRDALGADADRAHLLDMGDLGANPARILSAWREFLDRRSRPDLPARCVGEVIWPGRDEQVVAECQLHEALLNIALDGQISLRLTCPYDTTDLDDRVIAEAMRSHPTVRTDAATSVSQHYRGVVHAVEMFGRPLPPAPADCAALAFDLDSLPAVREFVTARAGRLLGGDRVDDAMLAAYEICGNSIRHGSGNGRIRMWSGADRLVCEVVDGGRITDPLVGRIAPGVDAVGGRGVWIANQLCDLVQIRSSAAGTTVRMTMWVS